MAFISMGNNITAVSQLFTNPYTGETLLVTGNYNTGFMPKTGTAALNDFLTTPVQSSLITLDNASGVAQISAIEIIQSSNGNDIIIMSSATHTYGNTFFSTGNGNDIVWANVGDDTIDGGNGNDILNGGPGNDIIRGGADTDILIGWTGNDTLQGGTGSDTMSGDDGIDTLDYSTSLLAVTIDLLNGTATGGDATGDTYSGMENVTGSNQTTERDWIWGDNGNNTILGLAGDDILEGGGGADTINGGDGWDYARYTRSSAGVNINLITNINTGGDAQGDIITNVEAVVGSNYDDVIVGGADKDYLRGEAGNDTLDGGAGTDQLFGGEGNDTYIYKSGRDTLHETGNGVERVVFDASLNIANLVISNNVFIFQSGVNELIFNNLSLFETFSFSGHADMTFAELKALTTPFTDLGTADDNTLIGTTAVQSFNGLAGTDTVDYSASTAAINIDLLAGSGSTGLAQGDTFVSIENVIGSNTSTVRDYLYGDAQDNALYGMAGDDLLEGGAGADIIDGGAGWDYARYTRSAEGVHINLETGINTGGDAAGDTILNIEAVTGSNFNDTLRGGDLNDQFNGGAGNDILTGGLGRDLLYGGTGADIFVFEATSAYERTDMIRDFSVTQGDKLDISDLLSGFDAADNIADFVTFTASGANLNVQINADGAVGGTFVTAFTIENTSGSLFGSLITDHSTVI